MTTPHRIQRKRTKGWRMPNNTVYVGRPTKWGNPFPVAKYGLEKALEYFRIVLTGDFSRLPESAKKDIKEWAYGKTASVGLDPELNVRIWLRGKNLACWCALSKPCHADVLLEIANA